MRGRRRVGVLAGGTAGERARSIRSARAVVAALLETGMDARLLFVDRDLDLVLRQERIEAAFLATRGRIGGDGCVQGLLETMGIPYTGADLLTAALGANRAKTRELWRLHNLPTLPAYTASASDERSPREVHDGFGHPALVRPVAAAAEAGLTLVRNPSELDAAFETAFRVDDDVLVERLDHAGKSGPEAWRILSFAWLDGRVLGAVDAGSLVDVTSGMRSSSMNAPRMTAVRFRALARTAEQAAAALGLVDLGLVEMLVSPTTEAIWDVDCAPALLPNGTFARLADRGGLPFPALCTHLLDRARLRAHGRRRERRTTQASFVGPERRADLAHSAH